MANMSRKDYLALSLEERLKIAGITMEEYRAAAVQTERVNEIFQCSQHVGMTYDEAIFSVVMEDTAEYE